MSYLWTLQIRAWNYICIKGRNFVFRDLTSLFYAFILYSYERFLRTTRTSRTHRLYDHNLNYIHFNPVFITVYWCPPVITVPIYCVNIFRSDLLWDKSCRVARIRHSGSTHDLNKPRRNAAITQRVQFQIRNTKNIRCATLASRILWVCVCVCVVRCTRNNNARTVIIIIILCRYKV